ncbi:hypothetical protein EJ05DRAFT_486343 [Pseudovirgaria hyperparasitica]|uniref:Uncharacterized protein n=1 Tax=Pseudovirgaria hyperparasitica TaxID=470096 RepID=A0A6A6W3T2_9PEZI|nr:uncharacterized protein EJ05DRAFT_486343 [Pseudovirgaria hyperparasitica]KAF2757273.1 hypothetical protein EJ05DRAFT_486343 [Pseudovirgaria hyperparasitica]
MYLNFKHDTDITISIATIRLARFVDCGCIRRSYTKDFTEDNTNEQHKLSVELFPPWDHWDSESPQASLSPSSRPQGYAANVRGAHSLALNRNPSIPNEETLSKVNKRKYENTTDEEVDGIQKKQERDNDSPTTLATPAVPATPATPILETIPTGDCRTSWVYPTLAKPWRHKHSQDRASESVSTERFTIREHETPTRT